MRLSQREQEALAAAVAFCAARPGVWSYAVEILPGASASQEYRRNVLRRLRSLGLTAAAGLEARRHAGEWQFRTAATQVREDVA